MLSGAGGIPVWQARAGHPVRRFALIFGLLNGLFAALQVAGSTWAALINHGAYAGLYYGAHGVGANPTVLIGWLTPELVAGYGLCLLGNIAGLWLCWHAGRAAAAATGQRGAGAQAGMLVSLLGSAIWIAASVLAVAAFHTDATVSGILAATPGRTSQYLGSEIIGLLVQEIIAALFALGFGALAGRIGAGAAHLPPRGAVAMGYVMPMPPPVPWQPPVPPGTVPPAYPPR